MLPSPRIQLPPLEEIKEVTFVYTSYSPMSEEHGDVGIILGEMIYLFSLSVLRVDAMTLIDALEKGPARTWYLLTKYAAIHHRVRDLALSYKKTVRLESATDTRSQR